MSRSNLTKEVKFRCRPTDVPQQKFSLQSLIKILIFQHSVQIFAALTDHRMMQAYTQVRAVPRSILAIILHLNYD
jgi:hypothetical protein